MGVHAIDSRCLLDCCPHCFFFLMLFIFTQTNFTGLAGICLSPLFSVGTTVRNYKHMSPSLVCYIGAGELSSGPHAFTASTLSPGPRGPFPVTSSPVVLWALVSLCHTLITEACLLLPHLIPKTCTDPKGQEFSQQQLLSCWTKILSNCRESCTGQKGLWRPSEQTGKSVSPGSVRARLIPHEARLVPVGSCVLYSLAVCLSWLWSPLFPKEN